MAKRALTFGARFKNKGRSVSVKQSPRNSKGYEVEIRRDGRRTRRSQHDDLGSAVKDFAASWRARLN